MDILKMYFFKPRFLYREIFVIIIVTLVSTLNNGSRFDQFDYLELITLSFSSSLFFFFPCPSSLLNVSQRRLKLQKIVEIVD